MSNRHRRGRSEASRPVLPNTSYAVLGFLAFGAELSGYELRQWALNLRFFYWSPAQSQIYGELRRLEALGYVSSREVEQKGRPDKRLHRITDAGRQAFQGWLNEAPVEPPVLKHSVALRLFFGHLARPGRLAELMDEYVAATRRLMAELGEVRQSIGQDPLFRYPGLVADWGEAYYSAEIDTAKRPAGRLMPGDSAPQ